MEPDLVFFDEIEEWPQLARRASLQRGTGTVARIAHPQSSIEPRRLVFKGKAMPLLDEWDLEMKAHFDAGLLDPLLKETRREE